MYTFCNPTPKFQFTYSQVFVMNFSCDSGWHYMSLNFSSHKTHGHKRSWQLKETKKKTDISHPNTLIKLGKKKIDCLKNKNFVQDS